MTRRDYILIAECLRNTRGIYAGENSENRIAQSVLACTAQLLAADLLHDNPNFDHDKFLAACWEASTARTFRNVPKSEQEWTCLDEEALDAAFAVLAKVKL